MNNLSSCFGLVDAKISASDKDLPVQHDDVGTKAGSGSRTSVVPAYLFNARNQGWYTRDAWPCSAPKSAGLSFVGCQ